jgi:predicted amidohydrolase YtcJ
MNYKKTFVKTKALIVFIFTTGILLLNGCLTKGRYQESADLVITNAEIYTVDAARSWAQSLAVRKDRIVYVGNNLDVKDYVGEKTRIIDLEGRLLLPAFHDSHTHMVLGGERLTQCILSNAKSIDEILERIQTYKQTHQSNTWLLGWGYDQSLFPEGNPNKKLLDSIILDRPAVFYGQGFHNLWVNSKALELAVINKETPDPEGGLIERDPATGEPSGTLRETAIQLILDHVPKITVQKRINGLKLAIEDANKYGIVSIQEANALPEYLEAYEVVEREGDLTVRVRTSLYFNPDKDDEDQIQWYLDSRKAHSSSRLTCGTVKLFLDGVIDGWTAAVLDVGDSAVRMGLNAVEVTRKLNGWRDTRHHMAHLNMIHPTDLLRFRQFKVVANFQPLFFGPNGYNMNLVMPRIGSERFRYLFSIRSILDNGAIVAAGSDWPVTTLNPIEAIEVAVTRGLQGAKNGPFENPQQRINLESIIAAYTINGAYVNYEEQNSGSIEEGKWADFIVLDKNLFEIPAYKIHKTKVLLTVMEGQEVYRAEDWNYK